MPVAIAIVLFSSLFGLIYPVGALLYYKLIRHDTRPVKDIYKEL